MLSIETNVKIYARLAGSIISASESLNIFEPNLDARHAHTTLWWAIWGDLISSLSSTHLCFKMLLDQRRTVETVEDMSYLREYGVWNIDVVNNEEHAKVRICLCALYLYIAPMEVWIPHLSISASHSPQLHMSPSRLDPIHLQRNFPVKNQSLKDHLQGLVSSSSPTKGFNRNEGGNQSGK